jgi:hypothetical protein
MESPRIRKQRDSTGRDRGRVSRDSGLQVHEQLVGRQQATREPLLVAVDDEALQILPVAIEPVLPGIESEQVFQRLVPGLLDRYLAHSGWEAQMVAEPEDASRPDNLCERWPGTRARMATSTVVEKASAPPAWLTTQAGAISPRRSASLA